MFLKQRIKNFLWGVFAVVMIVVGVVWFMSSPTPEHIEDTNGADNYSLQTITEQDIIEQQMGSKGTITQSEMKYNFVGLSISDGKKYSSDKFTGVYRLYTTTLFKDSDIDVNLAEFEIKEGNFAFYVVFDGEVVGQIEPDELGLAQFTLENVEKTATLEYVIAGESADFTFISPIEF